MTETLLSELTTLGVGGPAGSYVRADDEESIIDAVREADASGKPLLVLGGGSNLVIADRGFDGTVVHVASRGFDVLSEDNGQVRLWAAAGEPWDDLVRSSLDQGLSGLETLSGIPGITGATPVQNVGAYGTEISQHFGAAHVYDRRTGTRCRFTGDDLAFAYRTSMLKRDATGRDCGFHGNVGKETSVVVDYPFITARSTPDSVPAGRKLVEVLEQDLRRYGW